MYYMLNFKPNLCVGLNHFVLIPILQMEKLTSPAVK